jgi:hypothetical protein
MRKNYLAYLVLGLAAFVAGCASMVPPPTIAHYEYAATRWEGRKVDLAGGRALYIEKCGACHSVFPPTKFTEEKWTSDISEMKVKAKLTDEEASKILDYLIAEVAVSHK